MLSYDYRRLDDDRAAALTYLTPDQAKRYGAFFEGVVAENAVSTETVVSVRLVASGIVRTGPDRVDVLLFINRPTANKQTRRWSTTTRSPRRCARSMASGSLTV